MMAGDGGRAHAGVTLEERKLPMKFSWVACEPNCRGWVSAVGIVTADSPKDFDEFARGRQLGGATIVLDSSGGSVNDSIALGRRWRSLGALTTVGTSIRTRTAQGERASVAPEAYCELMCVFLLLSGKTRYVPDAAHVRVHQIWMGDRADDARAASYTAQDLMIVERDIGRLAKYTFDMGGTGDLLSLSLSVPPWEDLHELSRDELRLTNLVTTDAVAEVLLAGHARDADGRSDGQADAGSFRRAKRSATRKPPRRPRASRPRPRKPWFRPAASCRLRRSSIGDHPITVIPARQARTRNPAIVRRDSGVLAPARARNDGIRSSAYAEAGCFALASIWPIASTTASKVSMVEACRAL